MFLEGRSGGRKKDKWLFGWKISASVLLLLAILQNLSSDTTLLLAATAKLVVRQP